MTKKVKVIAMLLVNLFAFCMPVTAYAARPVPNDEMVVPLVDIEGKTDEETIADIPLDERMSYLFPNGVPTSSAGMQEYLTTIDVPACDTDGKERTITLTVHKELAEEVEAIFEEMAEAKFPIAEASCYCFRRMNNGTGTGALSHHSYGVAIDINWSANPHIMSGRPDENSPYFINDDIVKIWEGHGFYWGGAWSGRYVDPMHFSFTDH